MSAISPFWSRWMSSNRCAAIVSSGELSDAAISTRPIVKAIVRRRDGRSRRAARA